MITKITPETKLSEVCEVLAFIQGEKLLPISLELFKDQSGNILNHDNTVICKISELPKYLKENKPEKDYDSILSDPAAVKKILSRLPIKDILSEISGRFE